MHMRDPSPNNSNPSWTRANKKLTFHSEIRVKLVTTPRPGFKIRQAHKVEAGILCGQAVWCDTLCFIIKEYVHRVSVTSLDNVLNRSPTMTCNYFDHLYQFAWFVPTFYHGSVSLPFFGHGFPMRADILVTGMRAPHFTPGSIRLNYHPIQRHDRHGRKVLLGTQGTSVDSNVQLLHVQNALGLFHCAGKRMDHCLWKTLIVPLYDLQKIRGCIPHVKKHRLPTRTRKLKLCFEPLDLHIFWAEFYPVVVEAALSHRHCPRIGTEQLLQLVQIRLRIAALFKFQATRWMDADGVREPVVFHAEFLGFQCLRSRASRHDDAIQARRPSTVQDRIHVRFVHLLGPILATKHRIREIGTHVHHASCHRSHPAPPCDARQLRFRAM
mmetsp:Transcript_5755/g.35773  ORF Transcript_5755/g.35773 Transcript_5755/m.35773 type:complete len:382 (-) Transcript_5755:378-1523(-)